MDVNAGIEWAVNLPTLARDLNVTADGGYILVGDNGFMAKLDAAGNVLWQKTFTSGADLMSVKKTADGGFIVSGNLYVAGASDNVFLMKTDAGGNSIWEKNFGGAKTDIAGESGSVQQTTDGGYVVVGTTWTYSNELYNSNVYLIRTDANGNQKWYKTYGSTKTDMGYSVKQTSDGGFIIGGRYEYSTDGDAYLVKTDMLGNLTWQRTYGGTGSDYGYTAEQTADGGYILGGYTESFAQTNRDYYLVRLGYPIALTEGLEGALKTVPYEKTSKALAAPLAKR